MSELPRFQTDAQSILTPILSRFGFAEEDIRCSALSDSASYRSDTLSVVVLYEYYEDYLDVRIGPPEALYRSEKSGEVFYHEYLVKNLSAAVAETGTELDSHFGDGLDLRTDEGLREGILRVANCLEAFHLMQRSL